MKILQIGKYFPPYSYGGIEKASFDLHEELRSNEIDIDFLGFLPLNIKRNIFNKDGVYLCKTNIEFASTQFSLSFLLQYLNIKNKYDIIFVNLPNPIANIIMTILPPGKGKIVLCWHSDIIKQKFLLKIYNPFLKRLIRKSVAVVAPTKVHLTDSDYSKYFKNKGVVIPFVTNYMIHNSINNQEILRDTRKVILAVGRLIYYKGFEVLIKAAVSLSDECEIHIVGTGPLMIRLNKLIKSNSLEKKVFLLGRLSNEQLKKEFQNSYLFCLPSIFRSEMLGLVQFEAMSYGKPVVSTSIPRSGVSLVNQNNITGYIVPPGDHIELAKKINLLVKDQKEYKRLAYNALKYISDHNKLNKVGRYIDLFKTIFVNEEFNFENDVPIYKTKIPLNHQVE